MSLHKVVIRLNGDRRKKRKFHSLKIRKPKGIKGKIKINKNKKAKTSDQHQLNLSRQTPDLDIHWQSARQTNILASPEILHPDPTQPGLGFPQWAPQWFLLPFFQFLAIVRCQSRHNGLFEIFATMESGLLDLVQNPQISIESTPR